MAETQDILFVLNNLIENHAYRMDAYYNALGTLGLLIIDDARFFDLPIDPEKELETLDTADMERCAALIVMLLREDYWFDGAFDRRLSERWPQRIVQRMITLAKENR